MNVQHIEVLLMTIWHIGLVQIWIAAIATGLTLELALGRSAPAHAIVYNLKCTILALTIELILIPAAIALSAVVARFHLGIIHLDVVFHDHVLATVFDLLTNLFVFDLFYYWFHRAQHTYPVLWEVHKLHHSDAHYGTTTYSRHHWLEPILQSLLIQVPITILFDLTPIENAIGLSVTSGWAFFIHANLATRFGPLTTIVTSPAQHRLHHSSLKEHRNRNFAFFFPMIDILFETYHPPATDPYPTGIGRSTEQPRFVEVIWGPFIAWYGMLKRVGKPKSPLP